MRVMESKSLLITGLIPYDSGKTFLAINLLKEFRVRGLDTGVSKPVAGHSLWYQWSTYVDSLREKVLVGQDAISLKKISGSRDPLEVINPVDLATIPPDLLLRDLRDIEFLYTSYINARSIDITALGRVSMCRDNGDIDTNHFIIKDFIKKLNEPNKELIYDLAAKLEPKPIEINREDFIKVLHEKFVYIDRCLEKVMREHKLTIIESFNDAATPTRKALESDIVVVVLPGRLFVYNGSRYKMAFEVISDVMKNTINPFKRWVSTREVVRLLGGSYKYTLEIPHFLEEKKFRDKVSQLTDLLLNSLGI